MTEQCECCGLTYDRMRTGLVFADVRAMFWVDDEDQSRWVNKRRNTVLGRWRELKMKMWQEHLKMCTADNDLACEPLGYNEVAYE